MICESDYGAALSSIMACWVYNSIILCVAVLELCLNHIVDSVYVGGTEKFSDYCGWDLSYFYELLK